MPEVTVQWHEINQDVVGQRVDNYLLSTLKGVPKSMVYRILRKGEVRVNKGRVKPAYRLQLGDVVRIPPIRQSAIPQKMQPGSGLVSLLNDSILYEDKAMIVINKPSGLAVHGGSGISLGLIESLRQMRPEQSFLELVHRLDRDTSGCVMIAKSRCSLLDLQCQLQQGTMDKVYLALVGGRWPNRCCRIHNWLLKSQLTNGERMVRVVEANTDGAKLSTTEYSIEERFEGCTLVQARPVTGRTHQIRVHCCSTGHPILGDEKYGDRQLSSEYRSLGLKRLFLHALSLSFINLDNKPLTVEAPLSPELKAFLQKLAKQ